MTLRDGEPAQKPVLLPRDEATHFVPTYLCDACKTIIPKPNDRAAYLICLYAQNRQPAAIAELYQQRQYAIRRIVRRYLGTQASGELVHYVVVQAMIDIMENAGRFDCAQYGWPWMRTIVEHACVNYFRTRKRDRLRPTQFGGRNTDENGIDHNVTPEPSAPAFRSPSALADANERKLRIKQAIEPLPQLDRVIWKLHWRGWKNPEIADRLHINRQAVARRLHSVRNKIRWAFR